MKRRLGSGRISPPAAMVNGKNGYGIYSLNQVTSRWDTYEPHRDKTNKMA